MVDFIKMTYGERRLKMISGSYIKQLLKVKTQFTCEDE